MSASLCLRKSCLRSTGYSRAAIARCFQTSFIASQQKQESYTDRQTRLGRPISPHVTITKFPPVALSSITTRATGVALSIGLSGIGVMSLCGMDPSLLMASIGDTPLLGTVAKFTVSFPFIYHYLAGVRHLVWNNNPDLLTNEKVNTSSLALFGVSFLASVGVTFITL